MPRTITVNSSTLTFTRTSAQGDLPLVSTLSIDSVSIGLNGTVLRCLDIANPMISASTTIQIINVSLSEYNIIAGKFHGVQFPRIVNLYHFVGLILTNAHTQAHYILYNRAYFTASIFAVR